jgi:hydrogenase expression/formation protein HypD
VALRLLDQVFDVRAAAWRGFGEIPTSGLTLNTAYAHRDAALRFPVEVASVAEPKGCRCGEVLRGVIAPSACGLFRRVCTPRNPIGPCMVSAEGACAAFYKYGE